MTLIADIYPVVDAPFDLRFQSDMPHKECYEGGF
jgi:hypothetical protein